MKRLALFAVLGMLAACSRSPSEAPSSGFATGPTGSGTRTTFCQHFNVDLVKTMNLIGDDTTSDGQALTSLDQDLAELQQDERSSDSTVAGYATAIAGGIQAYEAAIRTYGLTAATDDHFGTLSDPIASVPADFCG